MSCFEVAWRLFSTPDGVAVLTFLILQRRYRIWRVASCTSTNPPPSVGCCRAENRNKWTNEVGGRGDSDYGRL